MPVEMLQQRQPTRGAVGVSPPRLRTKGQVGPQFYRQTPTAPKQSAVERLEADKAKYVKSQVALSKQQPVRPPELRKPLLSPAALLQTTRKASPLAVQAKVKVERVQLDIQHLTDLIGDVTDGLQTDAAAQPKDAETPDQNASASRKAGLVAPPVKERPRPPPRPDWSSPAKVRLKAHGPVRAEAAVTPAAAAASGTVRRVDVVPQPGPVRPPCRPLQFMRQPLKSMPLHSQLLLRPNALHPHPFPCKPLDSLPLKPPGLPLKPDVPTAELPGPAAPAFPPPSPAITRLSSGSSRKRRSLVRSKSDMSDRYSRAGTDLERFFNLCGLDPEDVQELTGSNTDIGSMARFRSVSAPGSECSGSKRGEGCEAEGEEEEEAGRAAERVPYGVSVIERNARVIKWLYGLRQAKDNCTKSTNL